MIQLNEEEEKRVSVAEYIAQLDEKETLALKIAQEHLGSSFNIVKSIGYIEWVTKSKG